MSPTPTGPRPYDSPLWKLLRREVLARDAYTCRDCGKPADRVDHRIPWRQGGSWFGKHNLAAVCRSCNTRRAYACGGRSGERRDEHPQDPPPSRDWYGTPEPWEW